MGSAVHVKPAFATAHGSSFGSVSVKNVETAPKCASAKNPVDLVHLSRQTLGDRSLEDEVLRLFKSQSVLFLDRLEKATTADERKLAAHTVVGSARGLGAWRVAEEAKQVEERCAYGCDISELRQAVNEANAYIETLLSV